MALPATIVNINTAGWSDHRNQNHGGIQQTTLYSSPSDDGTFYNLGDTHQYAGRLSAYTGQAGHRLIRVRFYLQRVGSPTGNVFVEVRPQIGSGATADPDFTALWGTSRSFPVTSIPTTGKNEVIFTFPIPVTLPAEETTAFAIVLTISAQGDASNYIKVYRGVNGDFGGSRNYGTSTWDTTGSVISPAHVVEISKSGAMVFGLDKTNNKARAYLSTDNGASWAEQSTSSVPSILATAGMKTIGSQGALQDLDASYVSMFTGSINAGTYKQPSAGNWQLLAQKGFGAVGANVSTTGPIGGGRRPNGNLIEIVQGATETNMGAPWRRIKLAFWNGSTWSNEFDVVGSANTPDATLPATNVHFDYRWSIVDPNGDCHIVFSRSDSSILQYRKFKADNTFTTINTLNGAVASATANYPVGQGTLAYKAPDYYVVVPYVDNTSNTLKESRCKTTITETSTNWVNTEIVSASAEVSGSNPALLMADNAQGGKVNCWYVVPTTKGLRFTHDSGNSSYIPAIDWKGATQVVGGISGFYVEDGIALVYLEEGTTPDELRYDRL